LELFVQLIEGVFYIWLAFNFLTLTNITPKRYFDWMITTPTMLINLMFYKTYGFFKEIIPAPSWLMLEDFGGILEINDFRNLFINNNKDYLVLHPPMITRQLQIEESYKKSLPGIVNKIEIFQENDLALKRTKPIDANNFNLEKTMGLRRKVKKFETN